MFCGRKISTYCRADSAHGCCWWPRLAAVFLRCVVLLLLGISLSGMELASTTIFGWMSSSPSLPSRSGPWGRLSCGECKASKSGEHTRRRSGACVITKSACVHMLRAGGTCEDRIGDIGLISCV